MKRRTSVRRAARIDLGWAFFKGGHGLSKDPVRARYWLKKVVDGECEIKHLNNKTKADAAEWLRALDD